MSDTFLYEETQRFRSPWLWALLLVPLIMPILPLGGILAYQLATGRLVGDRPIPNAELVPMFVGGLVLELLVLALFASAKLVVRVEQETLTIRFTPFLHKHYPLHEVASWEVRTFRPLTEYGGWGIRWGLDGKSWAYTVSGRRGVQVEFRNGRRLFLGSQHPEELAAALHQARSPG